MPSSSASEIGDDGDDADRPAHNSRDDVDEFEGGNRVRKDDDEGDRKEHGRGPDRPHLAGLARPDPETRRDAANVQVWCKSGRNASSTEPRTRSAANT